MEATFDAALSSGSFIDLVKLISKHDPVLCQHLHCANENQLLQEAQNGLLEIRVNKIRYVIYFAVLVHCIADAGCVEQVGHLSYVDVNEG
jgi:hypothetical protein